MRALATDGSQSFANAVAGWLDQPFDHLRPVLDAFIFRHRVKKWIVLSDYVLRQKGRPRSAAAFTLMPAGIYYDLITTLAGKVALADFKRSKKVSAEVGAFITYRRFFTFCFTFQRGPIPSLSMGEMRSFLDRSIDRMEQVAISDENRQRLHMKLKQLRQESKAKSFNHLLVADLLFMPAVAAYIALQVARRTKVERFGWFSDRDKIVEAHQGLAKDLFAMFLAEFWQEIEKKSSGPGLGMLIPGAWYDFMIRVPDHFASAIAGWDLSSASICTLSQKYQQVIGLVGKNPDRVQIIRLD